MTGIGTDNGNQVGFTMIGIDNGALLPATYSIVLTNGYSFAGNTVSGILSVT